MKKTISQQWVSQMAEELICEIVRQMGGIDLKGVPILPEKSAEKQMSAVYGETTGDFNIRMQLQAEPLLFERLAQNMTGDLVKSQEVIEEYATEFFNIVCGRFVSELYNVTGQSARFLPTLYERPPNITVLGEEDAVNTVRFVSDNDETAIFSWTVATKIAC